MLFKSYIGYIEGNDLSAIPMGYLAYPSQNVLIHKGVAYSRPGIVNDGTAPTTTQKIIGEFVWKDALSGELALRATGTKLQLKWNGKWITIFSSFSGSALRVRFATWTDSNGTIIKRRLFMVDGTDKIYEWNGGLATIASTSGATVTISGSLTLQQLGFDPGNATPQNVQIIRFSNGAVTDTTAYTNSDDCSTKVMTLNATPSPVPAAGDLLMAQVVTHTDILTGVLKDDLYDYQNRLTIGTLTSGRVYFSNVVTKLDYTVPAVSSRTAASPFFVDLPGNYTAMIQRFNQSTGLSVLWISTVDVWTKVNALLQADSYGNWVQIMTFAQSEHLGAYPFAVADYKGDTIYLAQDNTVRQITTIDVLAKDQLDLLSNEIEDLLKRLDTTEVRIYFFSRYIYIVYPKAGTTLMLDMVEGHWQTPQTLPMGLMSIIDGIAYGHSNVRDETFQLFSGRNDLGTPIQSVFAFGYYEGFQFHKGKTLPQDFNLKSHTKVAVSCRMTTETVAQCQQYMENDGAKSSPSFTIDGSTVKMYSVPDDESWASHIFGGASIGGEDDPANPLGRVYAFSKNLATAWFEYRLIITVNPKAGTTDQEFHLIGWFIDDALANRTVPDDLWIPVKGS